MHGSTRIASSGLRRLFEELLRPDRVVYAFADDDKDPKPDDDKDPKPDDDKDPKPDDDDDDDKLDLPRAKAKIAKVNSEAAGLRKRLKEAEVAEKKLQELEDAKKTDLERAAEKTKSLEDKATAAENEALRLKVALRKGLTETQAKRLIGATEEELETDADDLLDSFKTDPTKDGDPPTRRPKERLRGGNEPDDEPEETDPRKLAEGVSRV